MKMRGAHCESCVELSAGPAGMPARGASPAIVVGMPALICSHSGSSPMTGGTARGAARGGERRGREASAGLGERWSSLVLLGDRLLERELVSRRAPEGRTSRVFACRPSTDAGAALERRQLEAAAGGLRRSSPGSESAVFARKEP